MNTLLTIANSLGVFTALLGNGQQPAPPPVQASARLGVEPRTEGEWVQILRSSTPHDVKMQLIAAFGNCQKNASTEAQSAESAIIKYQLQLDRREASMAAINAQIEVALSADDEEAARHYASSLLDEEEGAAHLRVLLASAHKRSEAAAHEQRVIHSQFQKLQREIDTWAELRLTADAAQLRERTQELRGAINRVLGQLREAAVDDLSDASGRVNGQARVDAIEMRTRERLLDRKLRKRLQG